jgi:16S rRNA (cytosine967-C5)-methyltransferase
MTPGARIAASIVILDEILAGAPAEQALIRWGRGNRFAGSGDRAAIRDHVFDALRKRRSHAALGGAETGRGIMIGALRSRGTDPAVLFHGQGHAPPPLSEDEAGHVPGPLPDPVRLDMPDWLWPQLLADLGDRAEAVAETLRHRAEVHLRVNLRMADSDIAIAALAADGVVAVAHPSVKTGLQVTDNARKIQQSQAFLSGLIEMQDAASQAAVLRLPLRDGMQVIDYCAGGGGKALAMGALARLDLVAHDADAARMADLPARAARAGLAVTRAATQDLRPADIVFVDAPCSGSGTWRRNPDAKWRLTPAMLATLERTQAAILDDAAALVRPGGVLAYATCAILRRENRGQIEAFLARKQGWRLTDEMVLDPEQHWDGFYLAVLGRD